MKVGLYQDPRTPGIYYAIAVNGRSLAFKTPHGRLRLACWFGYTGARNPFAVIEWLAEKASAIVVPPAELEIEDPGIFGADKKL